MAVRVMPSSEALAVAYARSHATLITLIPSTPATSPQTARVATELPPSQTLSWLTVSLAAGIEKDPGHLDEYYLDLMAWGTKAEAELLIRTARAVFMDAHLVSHTRGVVSNPRTVLPPRWLPDESVNPPKPRYLCTVALTIHPPIL
jgi:hypothetical protein